MLNFDLGQPLNCIKTTNAAKLQFFRGLIIHFSFLVFCPYIALVRLTLYYLSTSIKCLALKSKMERANKNLTSLMDIVIYCVFKTSSAFILPF